MDARRRLLWIDGSAGLFAGAAMIILSGWLSQWYRLPIGLLLTMGVFNLIYGSYSTSLASCSIRPKALIVFLVVANLTWTVICLMLAFSFNQSASFIGIGHLVLEGLFVGGLACLEWRWRDLLLTA